MTIALTLKRVKSPYRPQQFAPLFQVVINTLMTEIYLHISCTFLASYHEIYVQRVIVSVFLFACLEKGIVGQVNVQSIFPRSNIVLESVFCN